MYIIRNGCPGCGSCINACPVKAIKLEKSKAVIDQNKCIKCGICASFCPVKLIKLEEEKKTAAAHTEAKTGKNTANAVKEVGSDA